MNVLFTEAALLPSGWARHVRLTIDDAGAIARVEVDASEAGAERLAGPVVPGMPNLHSHAFQRGMAGLTEQGGRGGDDFWGWREVMYRFLAALQPEDVRAIAAQLYLEMVCAGYTAVGEFHYLHNAPDGTPYADRAAMAEAILDAAGEIGIGLTLMPSLYQSSSFGGAAPTPGQRRFISGTDEILASIARLMARHRDDPQVRIGIAPHSLRAVPPQPLAVAIAALRRLDASAPIHIHVAEQQREVDQCLAWSGARPVDWLLDHAPVDEHWCIVHATHMTADERTRLARSGAVAALCPTTEGNLGDGFFDLAEYLSAGGRWGIGTDSHVSIDPAEELRWLDYGQRLRAERRMALGDRGGGTALWSAAAEGGRQALGRPIGRIEAGSRADLVVLDGGAPALYGRGGDMFADSLVFAGGAKLVRDVMIGGRWRVRERHHAAQQRIDAAYRRTLDRILSR
ncbi:MAG TPA: formimidoylglutamate deiminase [Stellaceae bacterium]|nr:formimidoylglutamate deiminase [Stellaceae bacterium]